jgi:hypothetical protein
MNTSKEHLEDWKRRQIVSWTRLEKFRTSEALRDILARITVNPLGQFFARN